MIFRFTSPQEPRGDSEEGKESKESKYVQKLCVVQREACSGRVARRGAETKIQRHIMDRVRGSPSLASACERGRGLR